MFGDTYDKIGPLFLTSNQPLKCLIILAMKNLLFLLQINLIRSKSFPLYKKKFSYPKTLPVILKIIFVNLNYSNRLSYTAALLVAIPVLEYRSY